MRLKLLSACFIFLLGMTAASAQGTGSIQAGNWGIAITDVFGLLAVRDKVLYDKAPNTWIEGHYFITDAIAVKPGLFMRKVTMEYRNNLNGQKTTTEGTNDEGEPDMGIRLAFDYYIQARGNLYMYAGPAFDFLGGTFDRTTNYNDLKVETHWTQYTIGLRLGAQYMITESFGIFGDIGLYYSKVTIDEEYRNSSGTTVDDSTDRINAIHTLTSGLGVIFYF